MLYLGWCPANGLMSIGQATVYGITFAICSLSSSIEASAKAHAKIHFPKDSHVR